MHKTFRDIVFEFLTIVEYSNDKESFIKEFEQINHMEALANIVSTLPQETQDKIKQTIDPKVVHALIPQLAYEQEYARVSGTAFAQHIQDVLPHLNDTQKEQIKTLLLESQKATQPSF